MELITDNQVEIMKRKLYEIHEYLRNKNWDGIASNSIISKYSPDQILFEIEEYPGIVTKCSYDDFEKAVCLEDEGVTEKGIWGWAQIWLNGERSDLSIECFFEFDGDILLKTTINKVHVL